MPGSSTSFSRSQRTAYWNISVGPSPEFHACAARVVSSSASAWLKAFSPAVRHVGRGAITVRVTECGTARH